MKVYCICLPKRKKHTTKFFETIQMTPTYTPVMTIDELEQQGINKLRRKGIIDDTYYKKLELVGDKELRKWYGKIACSLSHMNAMRQFVQDKEDIGLIFEDDNHTPDKTNVSTIHKRLEAIIHELDKSGSWYFCNLSPCVSEVQKQEQVSPNLYRNKLGFCMSAYLVTRKGAELLMQYLPLTEIYHTLDNYLSKFGETHPKRAFEVHPRLFRQKDNHTASSELGNVYDNPCVISEYYTGHNGNGNDRTQYITWLPVLNVIFALTLITGLVYRKRIITIIAIIGMVLANLSWFIYSQYNKKATVDRYLRDIKTVLPYVTQECVLHTGNEGYRLGDMVTVKRYREELEKYHLEKYPDSIASEYMRKTPEYDRIDILKKIIDNRRDTVQLPSEDEAIVHLRCGDVIDLDPHSVEEMLSRNTKYKNGIQYVYPISYYLDKIPGLLAKKIRKVTLVAGSHTKLDNYKKSCMYIYALKLLFEQHNFQVKLRLAKNPDEDFIFMSNSKYFIAAKGQFSHLVEIMLQLQNKINRK